MRKTNVMLKLKKMPPLIKSLIALSIGIILALILLELILQVYNPFEARIEGNKIILPVNNKITITNTQFLGLDDVIVHTKNSLGFRGADIPQEGLDKYLSIITVGGSTTECYYVTDNKTWPEILNQKLQTDFNKVWLNNGGLDGHSTFGHKILLEDHILDLKPKIVLFLIGANDIERMQESLCEHKTIMGDFHSRSLKAFILKTSQYSEAVSLSLNVYRALRAKLRGLGHLKKLNIANLEQISYPEPNLNDFLDKHRKEYIPFYEKRLKQLVMLCRNNSILPVLITQPALYGEGIDNQTGTDLAGIEINKISGHTKWQILQLYNNATKKIAEEDGVLAIDLANKLPKSSKYFYDYLHYTNAGCKKVADIIYQDLSNYLKGNYEKFLKNQTVLTMKNK